MLFQALEDETSRAILAATTEQPRSVQDLAEMIDASRSTIYRRIEWLTEHGLLQEGLELDKQGHHRQVYRAVIERVEIEFADETVRTHVTRREDAIDRFTRLWEDIRGED